MSVKTQVCILQKGNIRFSGPVCSFSISDQRLSLASIASPCRNQEGLMMDQLCLIQILVSSVIEELSAWALTVKVQDLLGRVGHGIFQ